ncbi:MAG: sulfite exporter TauE/SafE family protein [Bauldia sp.]|nr:sulfite exporter TauE/SafE family protein [Bauldia sp.]
MIGELIIICAALALGGFVKGVAGAGMPVVAIPVIASFLGVPFAVAVMVLPVIVTNIMQVIRFRGEAAAVARLRPMWIMAGVGIVIGTWLLTAAPEAWLSATLAAVLVAYVVLRFARPHWRIPPHAVNRVAPFAGLASGMLQGATGISAPISLTFLASVNLTRPQFILAVSVLFVTFATIQLPSLAVAGILTWERAFFSLLALGPVLVAMPLGARVARHLSQQAFDRVILVLLIAMAVKLFADSGLFG